jgi:hypothetical protein
MREQVRDLSSHVNSRMCYMSDPLGFGVTSAAYAVLLSENRGFGAREGRESKRRRRRRCALQALASQQI